MNKQKLKQPISVFRILFSHLILWPIVQLIAAICSDGFTILPGLLIQAIDLWDSCNKRGKFKEAQYQEMLDAIREGKER